MSNQKTNSNPSPLLNESPETVPQLDTEAGLKVGVSHMDDYGWIKLHRIAKFHWLYNEPRPLTKREAWENMLLMANHKPTKVLIDSELIDCGRGQSVMSLRSWAKEFRWGIQMVRTFFRLLENDKMIITEGLRKSTRITICNYDRYQDAQHGENTEITHRKHGENTEITTNKKDKNDKKEKKVDNNYLAMLDSYYQWHREKFGIDPKIDGVQVKSLKALIAYIKKLTVAGGKAGTDEDVAAAWAYVLNNWGKLDPFIQSKTKLSDINFNIQNIINTLKNGKPKRSSGVTEQELIDIANRAFPDS